jgi:hypothetical protein
VLGCFRRNLESERWLSGRRHWGQGNCCQGLQEPRGRRKQRLGGTRRRGAAGIGFSSGVGLLLSLGVLLGLPLLILHLRLLRPRGELT